MILKIKLKSLDKSLLNQYVLLLKKKKDSNFKILFLPLKTVRFTILASPHVNIKAREHFELQISKCLLYVTASSFIRPPAGIAYKIVFKKKFK